MFGSLGKQSEWPYGVQQHEGPLSLGELSSAVVGRVALRGTDWPAPKYPKAQGATVLDSEAPEPVRGLSPHMLLPEAERHSQGVMEKVPTSVVVNRRPRC